MVRERSGVRRWVGAMALGALVAAGCSSSGSDTKQATGATTATSAAPTAPETSVESTVTPESVANTEPSTTGIDTSVPATEAIASGDATGWTVLVYSIADTNLEPFMLDDLTEMGDVGTGENVNVVALVDRSAEYSSDPLLGIPDWTGAKLLEINQGAATELQDIGPLDTGDPAVLADFITAGINNYPAAHYSLILSDHGASWPGVGGDESAGYNTLTLAEINDAVSSGLAAAGVDKLDLLGFDACLMATYEVASILAPLAGRMLASQELEPGHGWDYRALQVLADDPNATADAFGAALIDGFEAQAKEQGTDVDITLSLIDLDQMGAVDAALAEFTAAIGERTADVAPVIGQSLATNLGFGKSPDPQEDTHMTDLGDLAAKVGIEALDISDQADALIRAINDVVVDKVSGSLTTAATGLSIYFPPYQELLNPDYAVAATSGGWAQFLDAYYAAGDTIPAEEMPQFENVDGQGDVFFDDDGLNIAGIFDLGAQPNLSEAVISYALDNGDGSVTFIGEEPAAISEDGSGQALGIYDLTALTISDGVDTAYAYLALTLDEESGIISIDVPMAYYSPDQMGGDVYQDVLLTLTLDGEGNILSETYYVYDDNLGTYGELTADPNGIVVPEVLTIGADGTQEWIPTSDVGLFADLPNLAYDLEPLPSGTALYVELAVYDYAGNTDSVFAYTTVP